MKCPYEDMKRLITIKTIQYYHQSLVLLYLGLEFPSMLSVRILDVCSMFRSVYFSGPVTLSCDDAEHLVGKAFTVVCCC